MRDAERGCLSPALIGIGGFAGSGKTAISRRLSAELHMPMLSAASLGRTIRSTAEAKDVQANAYWMAYEVLFRLCEEFIEASVSTILDLTLGWEFQWQHLDGIARQHPQAVFAPLILRCPREVCTERIHRRHEADAAYYDPPDVFDQPKHAGIWAYLAQLDRADVSFIEAGGPLDEVYEAVKRHVLEITAPGS